MKIGIVTIYNSQNCGSYLQTISLYNYIKNLGYNVSIVKNHMYVKNRFCYRFLMFIKYMLKLEFRKAFNILKTYMGFASARKKLKICSLKDNLDICIYGSDTIWNVENDYFGTEWKHYWGKTFNGIKIAYAPSISPTSVESVLKKKELLACLGDFYKVSVRDNETFQMASTVFNDNVIERVVDPTLLMEREFFEGIANKCDAENFVLFYYFGVMTEDVFRVIDGFAKRKGYKLICFGENIPQCDEYLVFNPLNMLGYFMKASMIITNTFHGNVFSLIFNKEFVNIDCNKTKVNNLLESVGLSSRTAYDTKSIEKILSYKIDYKNVNMILDKLKIDSKEYLKSTLNECERGINNES